MKKIIVSICFLTSLLSTLATAQMGCLSNSMNLKQRYDSKSYHPVACNCPCGFYKQLANRNQCTECGHFHDAKNFIMITPSPQASITKNPYPESAQKALETLINRSKNHLRS